jgi:hypothetical protein
MSKTISKPMNRIAKQFVVLDSSKTFRRRLGEQGSIQVSKKGELADALQQSSEETVWIVIRPGWTELLLEAVTAHALQQQKSMTFGDLLLLQPAARLELLPPLHSQFRRVVGEVPEFRMLPLDQLAEVLSSKSKTDLFIGGMVDQSSGTITLARGDLTQVTVPLSVFNTEGPCKPDFSRFELDDYGYALRFGEYEASAHSVLYKIDPAYRRRAAQRRIAEERGFGPSLRRLRILRRLSRDDFPGISSKTIARIERGETERPQGKTLENLAKLLRVVPTEIETY